MTKEKLSSAEFAALLLRLDQWWMESQADFCGELINVIDPELWREPPRLRG